MVKEYDVLLIYLNGYYFQRRLFKNKVTFFANEILKCLNLFSALMAIKTCSGKTCNDSFQFQMEIRKISRRRLRSLDYANLSHLKLLTTATP